MGAPCRKVRYMTAAGATRARGRVGNDGLNAYHCPACKGWHLGHDRSFAGARIRQLLELANKPARTRRGA